MPGCVLPQTTIAKERVSQFTNTLGQVLHMSTGGIPLEEYSADCGFVSYRGSVRQPGPGEGTVVRFSPKQGGWELQVCRGHAMKWDLIVFLLSD